MATLDPIILRGIHRGMADASNIADSLMPPTQFRLVHNFDNDIIGSSKRRSGYSRLGSAAVVAESNSILGIHEHKGTNDQIVSFVNLAGDTTTEAFYLSGSIWTNKSLGFTANNRVRAVSFLDKIMAVNGVNAPKSWSGATGTSWGTSSLVTAPIGSLIEVYKQQVYIADPITDTVYFSSVPTAGDITWTAADNFILNPNDGSHLTALKRYGQELLLFKDDFLYRFNARSTDADPLIFFGTPSQEAVTVAAGVCWFYDANRQGFFGYAGGYPEWISKPVDSFVKAIPTSNVTDVIAYSDNDHVEWFIGDVTVEGVAFVNVALRFVISTKTWCVRTYAHAFSAFSPYDDGTNLWILGGTTTADIVKMNNGNTDLSSNITYELETAWFTLGNNPSFEFTMASFSAFVENASGDLDVQFKTDRDSTWRSIGTCRQFTTTWGGINADFHRIKFRFLGTSNTDPVIFDGFSITVSVVEGLAKDSLTFNS